MLRWTDLSLAAHFAGQHLMLVDDERCAATPLLVMCAHELPDAHVLCLAESPLHYQHVARKLGVPAAASVRWVDLTAVAAASVEALEAALAGVDVHHVVVDSWFPLQCEGVSAIVLADLIGRLRERIGPRGVLVSLVHGDAFAEAVPLLAHTCDALLACRSVGAADVTGRLSSTARGQQEPLELLFTVGETGVHVRPV